MNGKRSKYSEFFNFSENAAQCKTCNKMVAFSKNSGTNNLRFHLASQHNYLMNQINVFCEDGSKKKNKQSIEDVMKQALNQFNIGENVTKRLTNEEKRDETINMAILQFIIMDNQSIRIVEQNGFQNLLSVISPRFRMPTMIKITGTHLPKLANHFEEKINNLIFEARSIGITSNRWTSENGEHSLLSVTAHWIDDLEFTPKCAVIGSCLVEGKRLTSDRLDDLINQSLVRFAITRNRITCFVNDDDSMMCNVESVHCFSHNLQLSFEEVFDSSSETIELIEKLKKIVKLAKQDVNIFTELGEVNHRWNSLYSMLTLFLDKKSDLLKWTDDTNLMFIGETEWEDIGRLQTVLQPFSEMTEALKGRFEAPLSVIIPSLRMLDFHFENIKKQHLKDEKFVQFIEKLRETVKRRTSNYHHNPLLRTATFVDPRFKDSFFPTSHKDHIIKILSDQVEQDRKNKETLERSLVDVLEESIFENFVRAFETVSEVDEVSNIEKEVTTYLNRAPSSTTDPFDFWKGCRSDFPHLSTLAFQTLGTPATLPENDNNVSVAELIENMERSMMSNDVLDSFIFCSFNLRIFGFNNSWQS